MTDLFFLEKTERKCDFQGSSCERASRVGFFDLMDQEEAERQKQNLKKQENC